MTDISSTSRRAFEGLRRQVETERQGRRMAEARADRVADELKGVLARLEGLEARIVRVEQRRPAAPLRPTSVVAPKMARETGLGGDMLYGVKAIAEYLGVRQRQALGLIERGHLPHYHVGKIVCANRGTLAAWLAEQQEGANGQRS